MREQLIAGLPRGTRSRLLPLLPSGPDGVHNLPLRGTQLSVVPANRQRDSIDDRQDRYPDVELYGGERGIRTLGTLLTYTRFPGVLLQPLGHLSVKGKYSISTRLCKGIYGGETVIRNLPAETAQSQNINQLKLLPLSPLRPTSTNVHQHQSTHGLYGESLKARFHIGAFFLY